MTERPTDDVRMVASMAELRGVLGPARRDARALILIGGADFTEVDRIAALRSFFATLATHLERTQTALVDGGTDSGVMRLIAGARDSQGGTFRLIGVAPAGALARPTRTGAPIEVARAHDLVVLAPGSHFGEETAWLFAAADHLGGGTAPTILVNGGELALDEAHQRLAAGHLVVAVDGSGRAAEELARELTTDEGLRVSGRLRVITLGVDALGLAAALDDGTGNQGARGLNP